MTGHIAVTGANGRLGAQLVRRLADHDVVAVTRRPPVSLPATARSAIADYADLPALRRAFDGVDTLLFVSSDGLAADVLVHHQNVVRAAADAGVAHVVALSGLDADLASPFCYGVTYGHTERLLRDSGIGFSVARASIFTEFFVRWFLRPARTSGELRLPAEDAGISLVSITDIARGMAALASAPPSGSVHELTGPAALTMADVAALASDAWRTPVRYRPITPAQFQHQLIDDGVDPWWCYAFGSMFASVREHRWEHVTGRGRSLRAVLSDER